VFDDLKGDRFEVWVIGSVLTVQRNQFLGQLLESARMKLNENSLDNISDFYMESTEKLTVIKKRAVDAKEPAMKI
jgi:hypothetical protein